MLLIVLVFANVFTGMLLALFFLIPSEKFFLLMRNSTPLFYKCVTCILLALLMDPFRENSYAYGALIVMVPANVFKCTLLAFHQKNPLREFFLVHREVIQPVWKILAQGLITPRGT